MRMNKMVALMMTAVIAFLWGCGEEPIYENTPDNNAVGKELSITATIVADNAPKAGYSDARIAFEQDDLIVKLTWVEGDKIYLSFVQDGVVYGGTATAKNLTNGNKSAEFTFSLPSEIEDGTFDLYGVYGGKGLKEGDASVALLPDNSNHGELASSDNDLMLYFASPGVKLDNPSLNVNFNHIGSMFNITLKNTGTSDLTNLKSIGLTTATGTSKWAYNADGKGTFDLTKGVFVNTDGAGEKITFNVGDKTVKAGESLSIWAWFPTVPGKDWPEMKTNIEYGAGATATSNNTKESRTLEAGKAYYLSVEWDGTVVKFAEAGGDPEPTNIIQNGGFEDPIDNTGTNAIYGFDFTTIMRGANYFSATSEKTYPTLTDAAPITDYVWFKKAVAHYQILGAINTVTSANSGSKSFLLLNSGGRTVDPGTTYKDQSLVQRVQLDDTKKYKLSFYTIKRANASDNTVYNYPFVLEKIYVGIVPSTHQDKPYVVELPLSQVEEWNEMSVTFDLPSIIASTPGMSFNSCAVFFGMDSGYSGGKTVRVRIDIDDVSLYEVE